MPTRTLLVLAVVAYLVLSPKKTPASSAASTANIQPGGQQQPQSDVGKGLDVAKSFIDAARAIAGEFGPKEQDKAKREEEAATVTNA